MSVGRISVLQEPGFKLRGIANPNIVWQAALEPLKRIVLKDLRDHFPTDCTHDQETGVERIQDWMLEGKTCFSVDLSDATNLMPRHLQMDLLRQRYQGSTPVDDKRLKQMIDGFEFVASQPWYYKDDSGQLSDVRFTRGQPLGLGPSFATFALAHNVLLQGICEKVRVNPVDTFCVLGDDVVISHPEVHRVYRETLVNLGCKVSEAKCLTSNRVAEFAGKVITPHKVIPVYKWRPINIHNMLDVCENYGPRSRMLLSSKFKRIFDAFAPIPSELGGLGWNPKGLSLEERLKTPLGSYLLDEALTKFNHNHVEGLTLVRYRTLTSLLQDFERQIHRSQLLPYVVRQEIVDFHPDVYSGYIPPTWRNQNLWEWNSSQIAVSQQRLEETPKYLLHKYVYLPGRSGSNEFARRIEDDRFGILYPCGINETGDPRTTVHRQLLRLMLSQCDALTGSATDDQAVIHQIQTAVLDAVGMLRDISQKPNIMNRHDFEFLARKCMSEDRTVLQDLKDERMESHHRLRL